MFQTMRAFLLQDSCQTSGEEVIIPIKSFDIHPISRDSTVRLAVQELHICIENSHKI